MGYKKTDPCLQKAFYDERLFVLMGRDSSSPRLVMEWIKENLERQPEEKLREAFDCALEMMRNRNEMSHRKHMESLGWISVHRELPPDGSECKVHYANGQEGGSVYWSHEEGFDAQTEPHHVEVSFWKDARPLKDE